MSPLRYVACLAAAALCLAGVGASYGQGTPASEPKKLRMAGIIFQDDDFFRLIQYGMKDAAKKNNVDLVTGNSDNKSEKEFQLVQTYTTQKVDAILISPLSSKGSTALKAASDAGIKVVTNNTGIDADYPVGDVECSASDLGDQTGKAAVKYINEKLGGKAKIAMLAFKSQVPEQSNARTGGFKKQIATVAGASIVSEQDAWLSDKAVQVAGDILTAHPEVNVIYAANEGGTAGAVLAVKKAGKAGKVAVFGTDVSAQLLGFLLSEDNILQAITAQKPYEVGQMTVEAAIKAVRKEPYEKKIVLNGTCLTREDQAAVKAYQKQLQDWMAGGP
jgi:sugar transport system substrate-binding protein